MANPQKDKGDRFEREAVRMLIELAPDLVSVDKPMRALGAGRLEDTGDLHLYIDAAIQVKAWKDLGGAIRQSAHGAAVQARNGSKPFAMGLVPVPRVPATSVKWLACCLEWPDMTIQREEVARFGMPPALVAHLRNEKLGIPRPRRLASLERKDLDPIIVAPIEAWIAAYRLARGATLAAAG